MLSPKTYIDLQAVIELKSRKNFEFQGFKPNDTLIQKSQTFYKVIQSRAPSDSKKQATLAKKGNFYEARLKVTSASSCSFEIYSKNDNVLESIQSLEKKFFNKILAWNKKRKDNFFSFQN